MFEKEKECSGHHSKIDYITKNENLINDTFQQKYLKNDNPTG
jgi:hypothetical protein